MSPMSPIPSGLPGSGAGCPGTHLSESAILGIVVGVCAVGFVMAAALLVFFCSRRKGRRLDSGKLPGGERSPGKAVAGKGEENNRLVFFQGCSFAFDLEDLLRASAEVLGKGTFGTAYKAILEDSTTVVVKRLREVGVGKREFEQQMEECDVLAKRENSLAQNGEHSIALVHKKENILAKSIDKLKKTSTEILTPRSKA